MLKYIRNLIQLIFSPEKGWEDLARADLSGMNLPDSGQSGSRAGRTGVGASDVYYNWISRQFRECFLPAIGICACSHFIRLFYEENPDIWGALQRSVITFVSLFLSAEFAKYVFQMYMPRLTATGSVDRGRAMEMIMYCVTFLGLVTLIANVVKVRIALIEFLPLYVIIIMWKGWKFMHIAENNIGLFVIMASLSVIGSVYILSLLLNALI